MFLKNRRNCKCVCDYQNDLWDICICGCDCLGHKEIELDHNYWYKRNIKQKFIRRR